MIGWLRRLFAGLTEAGRRSPQWPRVRAAHLAAHPECAACGRRDRLAVHHIYPFGWPGGAWLELERGNLITLCEGATINCHLWVGHLGDFRAANPQVRADAAAIRAKIRQRSYSPAGLTRSTPLLDC